MAGLKEFLLDNRNPMTLDALGASGPARIWREGQQAYREAQTLLDGLGAFTSGAGFLDEVVEQGRIQGEVLLQWGDFAFSVGTAAHQEIHRKTAWRWANQERLGRKPAQQFVGPDADTIQLKGVMYPDHSGSLEAMEGLRQQGNAGEPYLLVDHFGNVLGNFCLKSLDVTGTALDAYGQPRKIAFALELIEYGDDEDSAVDAASGVAA